MLFCIVIIENTRLLILEIDKTSDIRLLVGKKEDSLRLFLAARQVLLFSPRCTGVGISHLLYASPLLYLGRW